jgi:hypothetical protein
MGSWVQPERSAKLPSSRPALGVFSSDVCNIGLLLLCYFHLGFTVILPVLNVNTPMRGVEFDEANIRRWSRGAAVIRTP